MTPQSRRVFLGTSAAAAVAAGSSLVPVFAQRRPEVDSFAMALDKELIAALRLMAKNQTGEGPRRVASLLRLAALHRTGEDAKLKAALRSQIRKVGREAVLNTPTTLAELEANMRSWDFRIPVPARNPSREVRERVLNELLKNGVTTTWRVTADIFDVQSVELDRMAGAIRPVRIDQACYNIMTVMDALIITVALSCAFANAPLCIASSAALTAQIVQAHYWGCS